MNVSEHWAGIRTGKRKRQRVSSRLNRGSRPRRYRALQLEKEFSLSEQALRWSCKLGKREPGLAVQV